MIGLTWCRRLYNKIEAEQASRQWPGSNFQQIRCEIEPIAQLEIEFRLTALILRW